MYAQITMIFILKALVPNRRNTPCGWKCNTDGVTRILSPRDCLHILSFWVHYAKYSCTVCEGKEIVACSSV